MRKLLALGLLLAVTPAKAGESAYLGAIVVSGSSLTNLTTAAPFAIPPGAFLTINCTAAVNLLTDSTVATSSGANKGLPVPANTNFPTSVGRKLLARLNGLDTAQIAIIGTGTCDVWQRSGQE